MQREVLRGVFSPFFCINESAWLHVYCKIEHKMQEKQKRRSDRLTKMSVVLRMA